MKTKLQTIAFLLTFAFICMGASSALAFDAKYKYTIPSMETQEDIDKVTAFINALPGIMEITIMKENQEVIVFFDDEELDDEKFQLRIPLYKEGYKVTEYDILYEDPNKRN
jgi:copper chaperone CopZ